MKLSRERLMREAGTKGFRPESLGKVIRLVSLLNEIFRHEDLRERLVLKGGTALNLFLFEVPRLSVDIDPNYIGSADLKGMEADRPDRRQSSRRCSKRTTLVCGAWRWSTRGASGSFATSAPRARAGTWKWI